ncbi:isovaleryl-CoA dehydrogenase [Spongiibacter sp. KMU-166]|uniref:Isovaleryl-CoA dehydrogenase n=1 Tax=Spongiibacter thalassae TaxID=2721624 RepID=A0ABX1GJ86_9GAMM|nr:acyl-CoA dehydrogenase family protein [Spongiibacter thalassae]NKI19307.1 isovaleryl-CoA dehydrogenase [Spongiibacter thalassae]
MTDFFQLGDEHRELLDHADRIAREQLYPLAQKMDDDEWWPTEVFPQLGELGLLGVTVSPEYGGAGLDFLSCGVIAQAFGRWNHAMGLAWVVHDNLFANNIYANASEHLKQKYLPDVCAGKKIGALGLTEPGAGSDALGSMRTTAVKDGDHYVLNGAKIYITNGPIADLVLVYAKTDKNAGSKGVTAFLVETTTPGFKVAQKLTKMGFRGSQTAELVFEDCRIPAENIVGELGQGHKVVMSGLDLERAMINPLCVGIAERALELCVDYAKTREQFKQPIASFQMVQSRLADMYAWIESMKLMTYRALAACQKVGHGEAGRGEIHKITAAAIMYVANTMNQVVDNGVQIHGGSGYIWESEMNRLFRATKLMEIGAGTTEVRKLIIAGELLSE